MFNINDNVYIVNKECQFCTNSFDHCDFGCEKYNCFVIKKYIIKKIIITEEKIEYYCEDKNKNQYKFNNEDENIFISPTLARNKLARIISQI